MITSRHVNRKDKNLNENPMEIHNVSTMEPR